MDFGLSTAQEMMRSSARDFLEKECSKTVVRAMEDDEKGYSPELWSQMAKLGWLGLIFPEEYGGAGLGFVDLVVLLEEMGRALLPSPYLSTMVLGGLPIQIAGTERQKQKLLPKIISGESIVTLALTEASTSYNPSEIMSQATRRGRDYIISGTKLFVPYGHVADPLVVAVRTADSKLAEGDGITCFLVGTQNRGISRTLLDSPELDRHYEVVLDQVRVSDDDILGKSGQGWNLITSVLKYAIVAQCAMALGAMQQVLEMTINYAKQRVQFGKPIGSLQAIQFKCVDMLTDVDGTRVLTYQAAWKLSQGLPCSKEIAMTKAWTNEAARRIFKEAHQVFGGLGFTKKFDLQLYTRRIKGTELMFGDTNFYKEAIAQEIGI